MQTLPARYWIDKECPDLKEAVTAVRDEVLPSIPDFTDFRVYPVKGIRQLGKFVTGTAEHPILAVSPSAHRRASDKYTVDLETAMQSTIVHLLALAVMEARGLPLNVDRAEAVAKYWHNTGNLPEWVTEGKK